MCGPGASYGPEASAQAANLVSGHHIPIYRATVLLCEQPATPPRPPAQPPQAAVDTAVLDDLVSRYRALATAGLAANLYRRTATAKDARRLARRFRSFEDLILRFATRPDLDIFSSKRQ